MVTKVTEEALIPVLEYFSLYPEGHKWDDGGEEQQSEFSQCDFSLLKSKNGP
jgi:hypothetical protein